MLVGPSFYLTSKVFDHLTTSLVIFKRSKQESRVLTTAIPIGMEPTPPVKKDLSKLPHLILVFSLNVQCLVICGVNSNTCQLERFLWTRFGALAVGLWLII